MTEFLASLKISSPLLGSLDLFREPSARAFVLHALLPLVVGGIGVYLMLPSGEQVTNRANRWLGASLTTVCLVLLMAFPISDVGGSQNALLWCLGSLTKSGAFFALAFTSVVSALLMITSRNPVYSALWFAMVLLGNSGLYLVSGAEFLAGSTVIVYAGAIIVTFLFVIMLAQPKGTAPYDCVSREPMLSCLAGVLLAGALTGTLHFSSKLESIPGASSVVPNAPLVSKTIQQSRPSNRIDSTKPHVDGLGRSLFLDHFVAIEIIGVLLLAAVVGAMLIAAHRTDPGGDMEVAGGGA